MTTEEQAEAIVEKYRKILPFKLAPNYAIKCAINCAITEVVAVISSSPSLPIKGEGGYFYEDIELSTKYWQQILEHLKQM